MGRTGQTPDTASLHSSNKHKKRLIFLMYFNQNTLKFKHFHGPTLTLTSSSITVLTVIYLWIDVSKIQVCSGRVSDIMGTWRRIVQNCGDRKEGIISYSCLTGEHALCS